MRSRVIPGSSPTIERRWPTMALNSVDLPTFGRPTMTTEGSLDTYHHDRASVTAVFDAFRASVHGLLVPTHNEGPRLLGVFLVGVTQHARRDLGAALAQRFEIKHVPGFREGVGKRKSFGRLDGAKG